MDNISTLVDKIVAGSCSVEFCRRWLRESVDVNHAELLITAAEFARRGENHQIVQLLIDEFGVDVNFRDEVEEWPALLHAVLDTATYSTEETVRVLIDAGADVNFLLESGLTALMIAAFNSRYSSTEKTVRILIDAGADVNLQYKDYYTALTKCAYLYNKFGHKETVRMLIDAGADVNLKSDYGSAPKCGVRVCRTICATVIIGMLIEAI